MLVSASGSLFTWLRKLGKTQFGLGDVFGQDIVDVAVLIAFLGLHLSLPPRLEDLLQLLLLCGRQLICVLEQLE